MQHDLHTLLCAANIAGGWPTSAGGGLPGTPGGFSPHPGRSRINQSRFTSLGTNEMIDKSTLHQTFPVIEGEAIGQLGVAECDSALSDVKEGDSALSKNTLSQRSAK